MRGDKFTSSQVPANATSDNLFRVEFDDKKLISCVVTNTSLSDSGQTLWVGINSDSCILPLSPGESFPIAAREDALLKGYVSMHWDNQSMTRIGIVVMGTDIPEENNCD
jgi:hypothetical protein